MGNKGNDVMEEFGVNFLEIEVRLHLRCLFYDIKLGKIKAKTDELDNVNNLSV